MACAPRSHPIDIVLAPESVLIFLSCQPAALTVRFARFPARERRAVFLPLSIAVVGKKKFLTVLALTLSDLSPHRLTSPEPMMDLQTRFEKKIREEEKEKNRKKRKEYR
jgi:hypothetical protein